MKSTFGLIDEGGLPMLFAEGATQSAFTSFDPFILIFTVLIAIGLVRLVVAPKKNKFAIGFAAFSLAVFVFMDYIMVRGW
jgi:hypothetical protein